MAFRQIKSPALANQAVINTKLDVSAISGHSAKTSTALSGTFLLLDTDTNSLAKITAGSLIGSFTTNNLVEGTGESANLYFTPERAQLAVAADISDAVAAEAALRVAADNTLTTAINNEVTARTNADATLQSNITAEETARIAADSAEAIARASADLNLQNQIDFITANVDEEALDSLAEIVAAYQAADNAFTAAISANAAAISTETTNRVNADNTLQANIDAEVTARTNADATLQSNITAETNARTSADSTLTVNLAAEVTRATGVEAGLNTRLTTAEGDISTLETDLATEITRATSAEAANATNITAEQTARTNADAALQAELDATQTGSGLSTSGAYSAIGVYDADTNATGGFYIGGATSLANADKLLDSALKVEETARIEGDNALDARLDVIEGDATTAGSVAKALADAQAYADQAEVDAKEYSDSQDIAQTTAITTAFQAYADQAEVDAKAYTDAREVVITAAYEAADTALQNQINFIVSNTDEAALDSLTEIVAAFQEADGSLSGLIGANTTAINNEVSRATSAEATLTSNLATELTSRANADTTLQANIDAEATTRAAADTALQTAIDNEVTARTNADTALDGRLTSVETEMTATQAGAGLSVTGTYTAIGVYNADTNATGGYYIGGATSLANADKLLDSALKSAIDTEVTARTNADNTLQANIDAEATARAAADTTIILAATALTGRVTVNESDIADLEVNLAQEVSDRIAGDNALSSALTTETNARTSADTTLQTNITTEATTRAAADTALQTAIDNEVTARTNADATLTTNVATNATAIATNAANLTTEIANRIAGDSALDGRLTSVETEMTATQTGAGLSTSGAYSAIGVYDADTNATGGHYIGGATSLANADKLLDLALKAESGARVAADSANAVAISDEVTRATGAEATLQANIDTVAAGLATEILDRSEEDLLTLNASKQYTDTAITNLVNGADEALDTLKEVGDAFAAADSSLQNLITANSTRVTTLEGEMDSAEGRLTTIEAGQVTQNTSIAANTTAISNETTARIAADNALTAALEAYADTAESDANTYADGIVASAVTSLQAELDATQTGSGLSTSGAYSAIGVYDAETNATGGHYIGGATSLANADKLLDSALKAVDTAYKAADATLTANLATEVTSRTNADTTLQANIDAEATTRIAGDAATLTSANSYADGIVATETAARIAAISAEHQHHIDGDAATLTSANAYTDTREVAITAAYEAYADQAEVDAKAYTDTSVAAEASLRTAADGVLQTNITNEATTRATADTNLQNAINAEATTRASADTALDGRLTVVETEMTATQSGAGLNANGTYTAIGAFDAETNTAGGYYIATATSLKDADKKLDTALKAEEEARIAGDDANATAISNEVLRAENAEGALSAAITAEQSTRASADTALSTSISLVSGDLAQELIDRAAADTNLQNQIDFIVSNVDAEALDSLTEIVAAFQAADGSILSTVNSNTTAINDEVTRATAAEGVLQTNITAEQTARIAADNTLTSTVSALDTAYKAADVTLQTNIDGKVAKSGDTMSGVLNMGSNVITGLANPSVDADAVNLGYLNTALSAYDLSNFTTDDLAEGTKKYFSNELARAAFSASGNLSYNSATGVFSVDTSKALLGLTDYVGVETDYTAMNGYVLVVKADGSGVELVDPTTLSFAQSNRQVINGDGAQTAFALTFTTTQANAMVFVGGVIQDPDTHYAIASNTITFVEALPVGTQAVVIANQTTAVPVLTAGQVTSDNLAADIKPFIKGSAVSAGTGGAVVDSFDGSVYRTAKFIIQVDNGAGEYESREALVTHNGTSAFITEYAIVYTGAGLLGDASVQMNGSTVELVYSAASGTASVTVTGTYL